MNQNFVELTALKVSQPLGEFYVTKIPVEELLKITFSSEIRPNEEYLEDEIEFTGSQRAKKTDKLKQIGRYIDSVESAFPNTVILAANNTPEGRLVDDDNIRWKIDPMDNGLYKITIPTKRRLASIIDGQHRLEGFKYAENAERLTTELVCSVYFDLPLAYQAYIFSTINHNQTPVNKSLSYILYSYPFENETPEAWSPDKLSVVISRQLNSDPKSPFFKRIKVAPQIDKILLNPAKKGLGYISTATIVEGILTLITTDPWRDKDELAKKPIEDRKRENIASLEDASPLRKIYIKGGDAVIRSSVENFFTVVIKNLFTEKNETAFIQKTIGIQALFEVLKENLKVQLQNQELNHSVEYFEQLLSPLFNVNFTDQYLMQSSAIGKSRLKNFILFTLGYRTEFDPQDKDKPEEDRKRLIKTEDLTEYNRILATR